MAGDLSPQADAQPPIKRQKRKTPLTERSKKRFLAALADGETVEVAAYVAGKAKASFYLHRQKDEQFRDAWQQARNEGADKWEAMLTSRTKDGYVEEIKDGDGNVIRRHKKYYPPDLHLLLKSHRPETFREGYVPQTMQVGVNVIVEDRSASLAELFDVLRAAGVADVISGPAGPPLAEPAQLLAAPADRVGETSRLPRP